MPIDAVNWERPPEDPDDGCSGAWYRTAFIDSVDRCARRRTQSGGRIPNPRFDAADDLTQAAVLYLEDEEERAFAYVAQVREKRWRAKLERDASERPTGQPPTRGAALGRRRRP